MRWDALRAGSPAEGEPAAPPAPMLFEQRAVTRTFDTPAFRGMTFFEVQARSIINRVPDVGLGVSVGCADTGLWRGRERGTPSPQRRLEVCAAFSAAGLPCAVLMGPVVPFLSDSPARLEATVRQVAQAGATSVTPIVLKDRK